jgi:hypothetical protein
VGRTLLSDAFDFDVDLDFDLDFDFDFDFDLDDSASAATKKYTAPWKSGRFSAA